MKLYTNPASPFARKVRVIVREVNLTKQVEEIVVNPMTSEELRRVNPLGKIPALILYDGSALIDSRVICEYLNDMGGGKFFPGTSILRENSGRWRALGLQALGDGLADAAVARQYELRRPESERSQAFLDKQNAVIARTLDALEHVRFPKVPTIGEIAVACSLGYLDFREVAPGWRDTRPNLKAWYEDFAKFPSMVGTAPT